MLSERLAKLVDRHWRHVLVAWVLLAIGLAAVSPPWDAVARDGDLEYLPANSPSRVGGQLLKEAFPNERANSQVSIVLSRDGEPLEADDRRHGIAIAEALRAEPDLPTVDVWDETTEVVGDLLLAREGRAVMVVARLTSGVMDVGNAELLARVEALLDGLAPQRPDGLSVSVTGSAMIGGDMRASMAESLANTETMTIVLVLACLVAIYRSPLLVLIPLATIGLSLSVATDCVALLADNFGPGDHAWSNYKVFTTTKIFIVVILFGAGTDYCLFLIARYKEELARGAERDRAPGLALGHVAEALAGSALTTIVGLATMALADFGKFANSGPTVAICLAVALAACVTFTPALLRALGPLVFWPGDAVSAESRRPRDARLWGWVADAVMRRPATILALSVWASAPLVYYGADARVTHDFLAELSPDRVSVEGAATVRRHYGEGTIAPLRIVARLAEDAAGPDGEAVDLASPDGRFAIAPLHSAVYGIDAVADVRSLYLPTGGDPRKRSFLGGGAIRDLAASGSPITADTFVSSTGPHAGRVTQLAVLLADDPFSKTARDRVPEIEGSLARFVKRETLSGKPNPWHNAEVHLVGVTPGMRDLARVTDGDRVKIQVLTVAAVLGVLLVLLRRPLACCFLIATVLVSYYVTVGVTALFFEWLMGEAYLGLDWKLPIFLFVILIAVGQDYNIYLVTRVFEEQAKLGPVGGLRRAIVQTGGIITSCGVIMAGTFVSMAAGSLMGMVQLGFALALGVLLDTFFVRTVVVPCYFALAARSSAWREPTPARRAISDRKPHSTTADAKPSQEAVAAS